MVEGGTGGASEVGGGQLAEVRSHAPSSSLIPSLPLTQIQSLPHNTTRFTPPQADKCDFSGRRNEKRALFYLLLVSFIPYLRLNCLISRRPLPSQGADRILRLRPAPDTISSICARPPNNLYQQTYPFASLSNKSIRL